MIGNETDRIPDVFLDILSSLSDIYNYNTSKVAWTNFFRPRITTNLGKLDVSLIFLFQRFGKLCPALELKLVHCNNFKREWKYHLLINQIWFYCSPFAWFYYWINLSFACQHGSVHWLHTHTHKTWNTTL